MSCSVRRAGQILLPHCCCLCGHPSQLLPPWDAGKESLGCRGGEALGAGTSSPGLCPAHPIYAWSACAASASACEARCPRRDPLLPLGPSDFRLCFTPAPCPGPELCQACWRGWTQPCAQRRANVPVCCGGAGGVKRRSASGVASTEWASAEGEVLPAGATWAPLEWLRVCGRGSNTGSSSRLPVCLGLAAAAHPARVVRSVGACRHVEQRLTARAALPRWSLRRRWRCSSGGACCGC